jgi:hypothetical protein
MGYFSNGTEGLDFEETYCRHCVNMPEREDRGCPVWLAHLLFAYELCNKKEDPGKVILDMLIERDGDRGQRCMMFVDKRKKKLRTVVDVEEDQRFAKARPKLVDWEPKP